MLFALVSCQNTKMADLIVYNANVYTVDQDFSRAEAFAVKDGRIVAVGRNLEILDQFNAKKEIDLAGKYVYPGMIDAHCHFFSYGLNQQKADLVGTKSFDEVLSILKEHDQKPAIIILEKHGLVVADDSPDGALELVRKVIELCESKLLILKNDNITKIKKESVGFAKTNIQKALAKVTNRQVQVSHFINQTIAVFSDRQDAEELLSVIALTPDEMGFVDRPVIWLDSCDYENMAEKVSAVFSKRKELPVGFLIKDAGLFVPGENKFAAITAEVIVCSLFVRMNALNMGGINPLNKQQRDFIKNWEGEKFRVRMAKSS